MIMIAPSTSRTSEYIETTPAKADEIPPVSANLLSHLTPVRMFVP